VLNQGDGAVQRIDGKTGELLATIETGLSGNGGDIVCGGGYVWVSGSTIHRLAPHNRERTRIWGRGAAGRGSASSREPKFKLRHHPHPVTLAGMPLAVPLVSHGSGTQCRDLPESAAQPERSVRPAMGPAPAASMLLMRASLASSPISLHRSLDEIDPNLYEVAQMVDSGQ
jgi:hypothetical protein